MWTRINRQLKRSSPYVHSILKRYAAGWRDAAAPVIPCPKRVRGEFFWVHPRLLTTDTRDAEPHIWEWIRGRLSRGGVFFDIGAHYGWLSMKAARLVGRTGRVVAFEPSPQLLEILRFHQSRNRLSQLTVIGSAVAERDASAPLYLVNGGLSSRNSLTLSRPGMPFLESEPITTTEVTTVSLDRFCNENDLSPDLIKIDVEGAEGMVIRGAARILKETRPVVVLSTHPHWLPTSDSVPGILHFLARCGYRVKESHILTVQGYEIGDYLIAASP
jgi:FkbM family methyltransferase